MSEAEQGLPINPSTGNPVSREEAILLVEQALHRILNEPINHGQRGWQCGGAYWRLAQVLELYLYPRLAMEEGAEVASRIINDHGKIFRENDGRANRT